MKTDVVWSERIPIRDSLRNFVYDLCFNPDGTQVLVAVGNRILVYDASDGDLLHSLKGHRDYVYAVAYSRDGKRFASGGADKTIIIWTSKCEGILKYSHTESIQCLAYNPVTQQLASATATDFGLWSPEQKAVQKFKVAAKVLCCSWTNDGQYLALGQFNGHISVRDKSGTEKVRIERSQPIWTLQWAPPSMEAVQTDLLAVGCWDQTLSFYQLSGAQHGKDRQLGYDPCSLCYYGDGEYLVIGGSNKKISMYTKDGVHLRLINEREDWVWAVAPRPKHNYLAVGCNNGTVGMFHTVFSTVHGLYQDRYAHRDTMTDVIIQHLITDQKVRIKTRDYVKKIAVYRARLAVQLPDRVLVYETIHNDPYDMHYRLKEKVLKRLDCNLLVVTSANIILCQERRLQLYSFTGKKMREWVLEAVIRYIRVVGGPNGREGLLVGLKNGAVFKIFIDNKFPVLLIRHTAPIRCLDLSASRKKLAVVDEDSKVFVYDLLTQQATFEQNNANSVAWNTDMEEMFCYSGNQQLCIKTGDFPIHKQTLQGFVVGFKGSKIFCLHYLSMQTIDVPQSASLYRYLEKKDYDNAYKVACLGVTENDWRELAIRALSGLAFDYARKAFIRVRDVRYIELLNRIEIAKKSPNHDDMEFLADIQAFQGKYDDAAALYVKTGNKRRAIEMFLDLRNWEKAKAIVESVDATKDGSGVSMTDLLKRQAQWLTETNDMKAAADMYWGAKEYSTAIGIYGDNSWLDELMDKVRQLNKLQRKELGQAAQYFHKLGHHQYAKETYLKMDDVKSLMELHVELHKWDEAFELVKMRPELAKDIYLPYAEWLAINDRFDEAQDAFKMAGRPDESLRMLEQLTHNAVTENRYDDAGYYYFLLGMENLKLVKAETIDHLTPHDQHYRKQFDKYYQMAGLYHAYHHVYRYTDEPFTSILPDALFQTAQFIMNNTVDDTPFGVSKVYTLFTLAKQGRKLEAYKLSRQAFDKLLTLKLPPTWRSQIDLAHLTIRTKPYKDKDDLLLVCCRCSTVNPLLNSHGDTCINCAHPFIRSFCAFDTLPLVHFRISHEMSDEEAIKLIDADPEDKVKAKGGNNGGMSKWGDGGDDNDPNVQRMTFDDDGNDIEDETKDDNQDSFHDQLLHLEQNMDGSFPPIVCDAQCLRQMDSREVFVRHLPGNFNEYQYFRSIIPDVPIHMCDNCQQFFHEEDFEFHVLQKGNCPFCRKKVVIVEDEIF